jgi:hypothetical protein
MRKCHFRTIRLLPGPNGFPIPSTITFAAIHDGQSKLSIFCRSRQPTNPYFSPHSCLPFAHITPSAYDQPPTTLRGRTLLHKGFYDLLNSFSFSVLLGHTHTCSYEDIPAAPSNVAKRNELPPPVSPVTQRKGRRISKDMVSNRV